MSKRKIFRLRWSKRKGWWCLHGPGPTKYAGLTKEDSMTWVPGYVRSQKPSQLVVHNKDGQIAFERTYGEDPERHKG